MIAEYQQKAMPAIIAGVILGAIGGAVGRGGGATAIMGGLIGLVGQLAWAYGCAMLAQAKGHSAILGGLLGFFCSCIGLVVVLVLPDNTRG